MERRDVFVSVIVVTRDCNDVIEDGLLLLSHELEKAFTNHEILVIDTCSKDGTRETITGLLQKIPRVRLIGLTRTLSSEMALAAGMENAIGDVVVFFSLRNDPVDLIARGVHLCLSGNDVVVGVSKSCKPVWYPLFARCFRFLVGPMIEYQIPVFATDFRVMSRRTVNSILSEKHFHHNLFARISRLNLQATTMDYVFTRRGRVEESPESFISAFQRAVSVVVFSSTKPLRLMSLLGMAGSGLSACISGYSLLLNVFKQHVVEGWTTMVLFLSVQLFLVFLILAFIGEYVARIIEETADHKDYSVLFEKHSSVMIDEERLNVYHVSTREDVSLVQTGRDR
jgi:glycosyltransferase involved in cell wall biosynthesis